MNFTAPVDGKCQMLKPGQPATESVPKECKSECFSANYKPKMMKFCCPKDPNDPI